MKISITLLKFFIFSICFCSHSFSQTPPPPPGVNQMGPPYIWNGSVNNDWDNSGNWTRNGSEYLHHSAGETITIPSNLTYYPTIENPYDVYDSNWIQQEINMESGTSLIAKSTFSEDVLLTYSRTLDTENWYLVSSPVVGEKIQDVISNHTFAQGSGSNIGLATYNTSDNTWTYFTLSSTGTIPSGTGYAVKLNSSGNISFSGSMKTDNTSIPLTTSGDGYNLIGNPYPSYINSGSILSNSSNAIKSQTLWVWNQTNSSYDTKVAIDEFQIAPAQGFFVRSNGATGNILINEDDQSHQPTDTFQRTNTRSEIHITLSDNSIYKLAKIYYIDGATTGFDNGYDGPLFTGSSNNFAVYSHLVAGSEGIDYQIQSLPTDNYENMKIPIGINAASGTSLAISATTYNFPEGINIYLEDKEDETFTLLNDDNQYTTELETDLNGINRYYLHTTSNALGTDNLSAHNKIEIYTTTRDNLRIMGVQNGTAKIQLHNILGQEIFKNSFEGNRINDIQLPSLAKGIYIVQLLIESGKIQKKLIIR